MRAYFSLDKAVKSEILARLNNIDKALEAELIDSFNRRRVEMAPLIAKTLNFNEEIGGFTSANLSDSELIEEVRKSFSTDRYPEDVSKNYYDFVEEDLKREQLTSYFNLLPEWEVDRDLLTELTDRVSLGDSRIEYALEIGEASSINPTMSALEYIAVMGDDVLRNTRIGYTINKDNLVELEIQQKLVPVTREDQANPLPLREVRQWRELDPTDTLQVMFDKPLNLGTSNDQEELESSIREHVLEKMAKAYADYGDLLPSGGEDMQVFHIEK
jgi:hypothetical protein